MSEAVSSVLLGPDERRLEFTGAVTVGRSPLNDLVLEHPRVSGRHASIDWDGSAWRLRDLGSRNGTSVNRRRITAPKRLREGDVVRFAGESAWTVERLAAGPGPARWVSTVGIAATTASDGVHLHLHPVAAGEGSIRLTAGDQTWSATMRQRFVLLWLLGRAGGAWVADERLKSGLWGRSASQVDPSALHKLIYDVRRLLPARFGGAGLVEKRRGKTRLALPSDRIHVGDVP